MYPFSLHKLLRLRWLAGVLAIAIVVAQASGLLHKLDFDAHPAGIACATCVAYGHADTPLPSADVECPVLPVVIAEFSSFAAALTDSKLLQPRARGPPSLV